MPLTTANPLTQEIQMSIAVLLILIALVCFGMAAFLRTPPSPRLVAAGLFFLTLAQILGATSWFGLK